MAVQRKELSNISPREFAAWNSCLSSGGGIWTCCGERSPIIIRGICCCRNRMSKTRRGACVACASPSAVLFCTPHTPLWAPGGCKAEADQSRAGSPGPADRSLLTYRRKLACYLRSQSRKRLLSVSFLLLQACARSRRQCEADSRERGSEAIFCPVRRRPDLNLELRCAWPC